MMAVVDVGVLFEACALSSLDFSRHLDRVGHVHIMVACLWVEVGSGGQVNILAVVVQIRQLVSDGALSVLGQVRVQPAGVAFWDLGLLLVT